MTKNRGSGPKLPVPQVRLPRIRQSLTPAASANHSDPTETTTARPVLRTESFTIRYGDFSAVRGATLEILEKQVTAIIGPSGCGKSTLLRAFNRMNDFIPHMTVSGKAYYLGQDIHDTRTDPVELRRRIGMVFQKPNPFPKSIFRNVAWGATINGYRGNIEELVEQSLRQAALWDEVRDKLDESAFALSGGQQQRLCIARAIALQPEVLLMDEPCSALDPIATARIEDLIDELKASYTVALVTHNMQQAARVSDRTAFMYMGELIEVDATDTLFTRPADQRTQDYITGRFG
ncbi:MAG: phosphate ABC transporter ATP-binding protein [Phycisphaerae bacterium]|nr:phosphate ABC transporter ATP-binding protein [Phycisphaerae bacterium]